MKAIKRKVSDKSVKNGGTEYEVDLDVPQDLQEFVQVHGAEITYNLALADYLVKWQAAYRTVRNRKEDPLNHKKAMAHMATWKPSEGRTRLTPAERVQKLGLSKEELLAIAESL